MEMAEGSGRAAAAMDKQIEKSYAYLNRKNKIKVNNLINELEADQRGIRDVKYFQNGTLFSEVNRNYPRLRKRLLFADDDMPAVSLIKGHGKDGHFWATGNQLLPLDKVSVLKFTLLRIDPDEDDIVLGMVNLDVDAKLDTPIHEQSQSAELSPEGRLIAASLHRRGPNGDPWGSTFIEDHWGNESAYQKYGFQRAEQGSIIEFIITPVWGEMCKVQIRINSVPLWSAESNWDHEIFGVMEGNSRCTLDAGGSGLDFETPRWVPLISVSKPNTTIQMHQLREPNASDIERWNAGTREAKDAFANANPVLSEAEDISNDDEAQFQPVYNSLRF